LYHPPVFGLDDGEVLRSGDFNPSLPFGTVYFLLQGFFLRYVAVGKHFCILTLGSCYLAQIIMTTNLLEVGQPDSVTVVVNTSPMYSVKRFPEPRDQIERGEMGRLRPIDG